MRILQNRLVAVILVILIIVTATVVGAGVSLHSEREDLRVVYRSGDTRSSRGLADYIDDMVDDCRNMLTLAQNVDGSAPAAERLESCIDELERQTEPNHAKWQALVEVYDAAGQLDMYLFNQELGDLNKTMLDRLVANIDSNYHVIGRAQQTYNQAVEAFNSKLKAFPANIISSLIGIGPVERFE